MDFGGGSVKGHYRTAVADSGASAGTRLICVLKNARDKCFQIFTFSNPKLMCKRQVVVLEGCSLWMLLSYTSYPS